MLGHRDCELAGSMFKELATDTRIKDKFLVADIDMSKKWCSAS